MKFIKPQKKTPILTRAQVEQRDDWEGEIRLLTLKQIFVRVTMAVVLLTLMVYFALRM